MDTFDFWCIGAGNSLKFTLDADSLRRAPTDKVIVLGYDVTKRGDVTSLDILLKIRNF